MQTFYVGTYTTGTSRGLYRAQLHMHTGAIEGLQLVAELDNPAFFTLHPQLPLLFVCSEIRRDGKREGARLVAYRVDGEGALAMHSSQTTQGKGPCYVSTDTRGDLAFVAHYASGSVVAFPLRADGSIESVSSFHQHSGSGPRSDRQEGPHAHCVVPSPDSRFVYAVDLGIDQVLAYQVDVAKRTISALPESTYRANAGSGPRHLTFHPTEPLAFLIHELSNTLSLLSWDAATGELTELHTLSTLPDNVVVESTAAEVQVHPSGRYVFGSNRGHDSLVVYEFDASSRRLKVLQHIASGGKTPRHFRIDPSGTYLLVANQDSDSIAVFRIDPKTGQLTATTQIISVGNPSCLKFA